MRKGQAIRDSLRPKGGCDVGQELLGLWRTVPGHHEDDRHPSAPGLAFDRRRGGDCSGKGGRKAKREIFLTHPLKPRRFLKS
jgi:hypothetical protein